MGDGDVGVGKRELGSEGVENACGRAKAVVGVY